MFSNARLVVVVAGQGRRQREGLPALDHNLEGTGGGEGSPQDLEAQLQRKPPWGCVIVSGSLSHYKHDLLPRDLTDRLLCTPRFHSSSEKIPVRERGGARKNPQSRISKAILGLSPSR